jgi:uncharacterized protein DUF6677
LKQVRNEGRFGLAGKENRVETATKGAAAPADAWLMGLAAWVLPGTGHLLQGRWGRGLLLGGVVWIMFVFGLLVGGHLFALVGREEGVSALLQVPPAIANLGSGLLYLVCWATDTGFIDSSEQAKRATFEYGNTFLLVAGLLNYLSMLDAFDIRAGRKP